MITIIVVLVIIGVVLWAVGQLPIDLLMLQLIRVVVILFAVLWVLQAIGVLPWRLPGLR